MKRLTCEMCGSTDLLKQEGVFVCQACGCKYSVEEARKMMVEGTVDVSGSTVKVDTSDELSNLYQIARRAKDDNNSENAAKYYDLILMKDPTSWEASFYVVYFKAISCKIGQIRSAALSVSNCQGSVLGLIRDNVPEDKQASAVNEVLIRSTLAANMLAKGAEEHYHGISSNIQHQYKQEYVDNVCAAREIMYTCGSQIEHYFGDRKEIASYAADAWKVGIEIHTKILPYLADSQVNKSIILLYAKKIEKYNPAYARKYIYADKIKQLESEIAELDNIIMNTTVDNETDRNDRRKALAWGIMFIIVGIGYFIMMEGSFWGCILGLFFLAFGILSIGISTQKSDLEGNRKKVQEAAENRKIKKAELDRLTR